MKYVDTGEGTGYNEITLANGQVIRSGKYTDVFPLSGDFRLEYAPDDPQTEYHWLLRRDNEIIGQGRSPDEALERACDELERRIQDRQYDLLLLRRGHQR